MLLCVLVTFQVSNVVPSLSAVTGISPGRYLWRISIAFHLGPRLLVVLTYYHFLMAFVSRLKSKEAGQKLSSLLNYCFYLQIAEIAGLCLISFVHNREHYRKYTPFETMGGTVGKINSHCNMKGLNIDRVFFLPITILTEKNY